MRKKWLLVIPVVLVLAYVAGPAPATPSYNTEMPDVPSGPAALEKYVENNEAQHRIKPENEAKIIWAGDSVHKKTAYAIVYLHGFSVSQAEGDPVHENIAREFGCNLYLARLAEHGIDTVDAMLNLDAENYWESAKKALAIGKQLGDKVILMSTSAGGALSLKLAATFPNDVYAQVLLSPCIAINDPNAWLLNNHWGLQIARMVLKSDYVNSKDDRPLNKQFWYTHYRVEAAAALQEFLETSMTKATFEKVKQPTEMLYYYKDDIHQDSTVKVSAMLTMFDELGTPAGLKTKQAMPNTGSHVIGSYIRSKDVEGVQKEVENFFKTTLKIPVALQ